MNPTRRTLLIGGSILGVCAAGGLLPTACAMRQIKKGTVASMNEHPQRPQGKAKPMLEEDIAPVLARLDRATCESVAAVEAKATEEVRTGKT